MNSAIFITDKDAHATLLEKRSINVGPTAFSNDKILMVLASKQCMFLKVNYVLK